VVDRHVEDCDPAVAADELLPVRARVHDDLRHDRRSQVSAVEERLQRAHRLVVAHVLVHGECLAGLLGDADDLLCVVERGGDRLLREDPFHVLTRTRLPYDLELLVGRECDVDDLHPGVVDQLAPGVVHLRHAPLLSGRPRVLRRA
jgi:hypothetical protein